METKRDILAACDLSEFSLPVLKMAGRMADDTKRKLIVAHVIHHRDVDSVAYAMTMEGLFSKAPSPEEFLERLSQERAKKLKGFISLADADRYVSRIKIVVGHPFDELMKIIQTENAYMAVIGNKGRGNIAGLLAGSTAQKLLSHCQGPLLCVPSTSQRRVEMGK